MEDMNMTSSTLSILEETVIAQSAHLNESLAINEEVILAELASVNNKNKDVKACDDRDAADNISAVVELTGDLSAMSDEEYMLKIKALSNFDRKIVDILNTNKGLNK